MDDALSCQVVRYGVEQSWYDSQERGEKNGGKHEGKLGSGSAEERKDEEEVCDADCN